MENTLSDRITKLHDYQQAMILIHLLCDLDKNQIEQIKKKVEMYERINKGWRSLYDRHDFITHITGTLIIFLIILVILQWKGWEQCRLKN